MYDVAIVGSGPAGSAAAIALRTTLPAGRVVVLEAREHPREKACGGAVSPRGVRILHDLGVPLSVPHRTVRAAVLTAASGTRYVIDQPMGVVTRRPELDAMLIAAAIGRGAELRERCRVTAIHDAGPAVRLETEHGRLEARWVIGADGSAGITGVHVAPFARAPIRAVDAVTPPRPTDADALHFDFSLTGRGLRGYAWDFPCLRDGAPATNRGVYATRDSAKGPRAFSVERDGIQAALQGFIVRGYEKERRLGRGRVVLAGDAVGANALTGEGIAPALEGGMHAARWVATALQQGTPDASDYTRCFRQTTLARRLAWWCGIAKRLYGPSGDWWTEVAMSDRGFHRLMAADYAGELDAPDVAPRFVRYLVGDVARYWARGGAPGTRLLP